MACLTDDWETWIIYMGVTDKRQSYIRMIEIEYHKCLKPEPQKKDGISVTSCSSVEVLHDPVVPVCKKILYAEFELS